MDKTILVVDDDTKLRDLLKEYLEEYGYRILALPDGSDAVETIRTKSPDMVILDIMLPGKDGLEILRDIRAESGVPVIMLTARGEDADRIVGLELGADDYLPKPFNPRELLARIKAVLRRAAASSEPPPEGEGVVSAGGLALDPARQSVRVGDRAVSLSTTECRILDALMRHPNQVMSRDRLMNLARGRDFMAFDRSIDVHISKLRAKVESDPRKPERIKTVWGTGYMFADTR